MTTMHPSQPPQPPRNPAPPAIAVVVELLEGGRPECSLAPGQALVACRRVVLAKGARLSLIHLPSGEAWAFAGPCRFSFDAQGRPRGAAPVTRRRVALLQGQYRLNGVELAQAALVMRQGHGANPLQVEPKGPGLLEPRPTFRWSAPSPSLAYRFALQDDRGRQTLNTVVRVPEVVLPAQVTLQEGVTYTWVLEGPDAKGQPSAWSGEVRLLDEPTRTFLAENRPGADAPQAERLAFTLLCRQLGSAEQ